MKGGPVMDQPVVDQLRHAYAALAAGDPRPMAVVLAEDVVYHLPGRHLGGGLLCGRREIFDRLAAAAKYCDAPPSIDVIDAIHQGPFVASLERFHANRGDAALSQDICVVWRVANRRFVEVWAHFENQENCDDFWAEFT